MSCVKPQKDTAGDWEELGKAQFHPLLSEEDKVEIHLTVMFSWESFEQTYFTLFNVITTKN